jgi:hypothetical protein
MVFLNQYLNIHLLTIGFALKIGFIAFVAWAPLAAMSFLHRRCYPSEDDKVMMKVVSKLPRNRIHAVWRKFREWMKFRSDNPTKAEFLGIQNDCKKIFDQNLKIRW